MLRDDERRVIAFQRVDNRGRLRLELSNRDDPIFDPDASHAEPSRNGLISGLNMV
jgi:hypothetical protein